AVYYVKNSGDDYASGLSDKTAWRTIGKVNKFTFKNGDEVRFKRGDIFDDATLESPGVDNFTIADYGNGMKPLFDGDKIRPIYIKGNIRNITIRNINISGQGRNRKRHDYNLKFKGVIGITIDGVDGNGIMGSDVGNPGNASWEYGKDGTDGDNRNYYWGKDAIGIVKCAGPVVIKNCTLHDWGPNDLPVINDKGIVIIRIQEHMKEEGYIKIHNNILYRVNSDTIQMLSSEVPTEIFNNVLHSGGENSIDIKGSSNCKIYRNEFYREKGFGLGGDTGFKKGFDPKTAGSGPIIVIHSYKDMFSEDIEIYDNYFHNTGHSGSRYAIRLSGNSQRIKIHNNSFKDVKVALCLKSMAKDVEFFNNVIIDPVMGTDCFRGDCSAIYISNSGNARNQKIHHNTIYSSKKNKYLIQLVKTRGVFIENNIAYHTNKDKDSFVLIWKGEGEKPIVNCNIWYNESNLNRIKWDHKSYRSSDHKVWTQAGHSGDLFNDPNFNDIKLKDFSLKKKVFCNNSEIGAVLVK
ncbi:MAG: right-handed parallel beta-helix repeat-containing protein, partial [Melioribacteraceae bacterium]|nr:right-handed parallel beta-helix repeat-containing protein [Melioribacteraceae bacterium]